MNIDRTAVAGRLVVLSPHCDDAVWSLGGALSNWSQQTKVSVVTIFDGDPPSAKSLAPATNEVGAGPSIKSDGWRGAAASTLRRAEDEAALGLLHCQRVGLNLAEAAFRVLPQGGFEHESLASLVGVPCGAHRAVSDGSLVRSLMRELRHDDTLLVPLAVGGHVDHCRVHWAARCLPHKRFYYAEFPYANPVDAARMADHLQTLELALEPIDIPCDWEPWQRAALRYRSQVLRMFGSGRRFIEELEAYVLRTGSQASCRIWSTRAM